MNIITLLSLLLMNELSEPTQNLYYGHNLLSIYHVFYDSSRENTIIEVGGAYYGFIDELQNTTSKGDTIAFSDNGTLVRKNNELFYTNNHLKTKFKLKEYKRSKRKDHLRRKIFDDFFQQFTKDCHNAQILEKTYIEFRDNMNIPTNCIEYLKGYYKNLLITDEQFEFHHVSQIFLHKKTDKNPRFIDINRESFVNGVAIEAEELSRLKEILLRCNRKKHLLYVLGPNSTQFFAMINNKEQKEDYIWMIPEFFYYSKTGKYYVIKKKEDKEWMKDFFEKYNPK